MNLEELNPYLAALAKVVVDEFNVQIERIAASKPDPSQFKTMSQQLREEVYQAVNAKLDELPSSVVQSLLAHCLTDDGLSVQVDCLRKRLTEI